LVVIRVNLIRRNNKKRDWWKKIFGFYNNDEIYYVESSMRYCTCMYS